MTRRLRSYKELRSLQTFQERYDYLQLGGLVGAETFGYERHLNQSFYRSTQWRNLRHQIIARDEGRDLGITGHEIFDRVIIHHMNPMTVEDVRHGNEDILDPNYLICVSLQTHNAIHYGDASKLPKRYVERRPGDTKLWG